MASPRSVRLALALLLPSITIGATLGSSGCGEYLTSGGVSGVAYTPEGQLVAFGNDATYVFDADAQQEVRSFSTPSRFRWIPVPSQMALSADGKIAAVGNGKAVDVYDVASGSQRAHIPVYDAVEDDAPIAGVTLSSDGAVVAVALRPSYWGVPRLGIWRVADQTLVAEVQQPVERKYWSWGAGLAFSPDDQILYALVAGGPRGEPGTAYLTSWNAQDCTLRREQPILNGAEPEAYSTANLLALSPDGLTLATAGSELRRWDAVTLALLANFPSPNAMATFGTSSLAFSPDSRDLVTTHATNSGPDPQILGPDGSVVRSWPIAESIGCESAVFSPDGTRIAAACAQYLRIWDIATGRQLQARKITGQVY